MNDQESRFHPLVAIERLSQPLFQLLGLFLILASLWALVDQWKLQGRSVDMVLGTPHTIEEEMAGDRVAYRLPFTLQTTGEEVSFWLTNGSRTLTYLDTAPADNVIALRYWTNDRIVFKVHPLVYGIAPIRDRVAPSLLVWGTALLGLAVALVLLFPGALERTLDRLGQRSLRR